MGRKLNKKWLILCDDFALEKRTLNYAKKLYDQYVVEENCRRR